VACLLACVIPATAAASLTMLIGAAEDEGRNADPVLSQMKMDLAKAAGFDAIRITEVWTPGQTALTADDRAVLANTSQTATFDGITLFATIMPYGSKTTPLTATARRDFALYAADVVRQAPAIRDVIIGNEPNINRYWLPQFNPDGTDAAAPAYEALLAQTYDAIKKVRPSEVVIGGSVSPHGSDNPALSRQTHSPTAFILDMGAAYRASGRKKPIMDAFALHPYGDNSSVPPTTAHLDSTSIGVADYDKVVSLLGQAFDGTAQAGSSLPLYYDEYGVETQIPASKLSLYTGTEPATTKPVPVATQALYYDEALTMAACQPNVKGMFLFHVTDETDLSRWQSGLYYADDTPKASLPIVKQTIEQIHEGAVDCTASNAIDDDGWVLASAKPARTPGTRVGKSPKKPKPKKTAAPKKTTLAPARIWELFGTGL